MYPNLACTLFVCIGGSLLAGQPMFPRFKVVEIDAHIEIGYGVTVADVDGDGKPDILLADKKQIVWYRNPTWQKFVMTENLTAQDDVCIAAADIDGDGKAEVAVGAQWNPGDTLSSGAVSTCATTHGSNPKMGAGRVATRTHRASNALDANTGWLRVGGGAAARSREPGRPG